MVLLNVQARSRDVCAQTCKTCIRLQCKSRFEVDAVGRNFEREIVGVDKSDFSPA